MRAASAATSRLTRTTVTWPWRHCSSSRVPSGALQAEGRQAGAAGEVPELLRVLGQQVRARRCHLLLGNLVGLDLRSPPVVQLGRPLAGHPRSCIIQVMLSSRARSLSKS